MKKILGFAFTLLFIVTQNSFGQSILKGNWTGTLLQEVTGNTPFGNYKFSMNIEVSGTSISGKSTIITGTNFGILHFTGSIKDSVFSFVEDKINDENPFKTFDWCFKSGSLKIHKKNGTYVMEGSWHGYTKYGNHISECSPGTIYLEKEIGYISMKGSVVDSTTSRPIPAHIKIVNLKNGKTVSDFPATKGEFDLHLPESNEYEITITGKGYYTRYEHVRLTKSVILNIPLQPITTGQTLPLQSVLFAQSTSTILASSFPELDRLAVFLKDNPTIRIQLEGHTSNEGDPVKNKELSYQRVESIQTFLLEKNISRDRIQLKAFGAEKPLVPNDTDLHRKQNRRVEFVIVSK